MGLSDGRPDLILCEGQGYDEALILLKAMAGSDPPSPLILLGHSDVDAKSWPIGSRVTYLSKPIRPAKLRALMHHLLREEAPRSEEITSAA